MNSKAATSAGISYRGASTSWLWPITRSCHRHAHSLTGRANNYRHERMQPVSSCMFADDAQEYPSNSAQSRTERSTISPPWWRTEATIITPGVAAFNGSVRWPPFWPWYAPAAGQTGQRSDLAPAWMDAQCPGEHLRNGTMSLCQLEFIMRFIIVHPSIHPLRAITRPIESSGTKPMAIYSNGHRNGPIRTQT